jgi:hypothetical protein
VSPPAPLHPKSIARPGPDHEALYGSSYFDEQLHRQHWFHNNAAKRKLRWQEVVRMLAIVFWRSDARRANTRYDWPNSFAKLSA